MPKKLRCVVVRVAERYGYRCYVLQTGSDER